MKYFISVLVLIILLSIISLLYYEPKHNTLPQDLSVVTEVSEDTSFFDCLAYSHRVTGEGLLAREAAMQALVTKIIDWSRLQLHRLSNCF